MKENLPDVKRTSIRYDRVLLLMVMMLFCYGGWAQHIVQGRVTDENGTEGLPGVAIVVQGTADGTITDLDGNFKLSVPNEDVTLELSFIGYRKQLIELNGRSTINVTMQVDVQALDEVVVVGFGTQKKQSVVGSISSTDGKKVVEAGGVTTVSEALAGLMPGVTTQQNAGIPGASQSNILIRGMSTWSDSSPLVLVDGIERDMNNIDPNEIKSITVLKDASATAVYGSRAGNGAIIVTTKDGVKGKVKVNYTANFGFKEPVSNVDYIASIGETMRAFNEASRNDRQFGQIIPDSEIARWEDPNRNPDLYTYTTWVDDLIGTGTAQSHNINLSGGNDFVTFFTSIGYNYDGDVFDIDKQPEFDPRTWQKRYNFRQNMTFNLTKTTKVDVKLSNQITNWNGNPGTASGGATGYNVNNSNLTLSRLFSSAAMVPIQYSTGEWTREEGSSIPTNYRGLFERNGQISKKAARTWTDLIVRQDLKALVPGLTFNAKLSYNNYTQYQQSLNYGELYYIRNRNNTVFDPETGEVIELGLEPFNGPQAVQTPPVLQGESLTNYSQRLYYEGSFNYQRTFDKHNLSALALFYRQEDRQGAAKFATHRESWVGRVTYNYDERYFLEANGSYMGSDKFAEGKRFGFFPSMAAGWILTNEPFMESIKGSWLDLVKFRYSYGQVGIDKSFDAWSYRATYTEDTRAFYHVFFGQNRAVLGGKITEARIPNPNATWENSTKQNIGIELGFFNSQLTLTTDLFDEKRENLQFKRSETSSTLAGYRTDPIATSGKTKNHGIEFDLRWEQVLNSDFRYWVRGNYSFSENRVITRDDPEGRPDYQKEAGKPIGVQTGLIVADHLNSWDDVYNSSASSWEPQLIPGDFRFVDYNGDGIITDLDRVPIGVGYQATSYAFSGGIFFKGFAASVNFTGVDGVYKNLSFNYLWSDETSSTFGYQLNNTEAMDSWTPDNLDAKAPVRRINNNHNKANRNPTTYSIRDADFLRLRTAEISYELPVKRFRYLKVFDRFQIYVNGNNLWTWTKVPPEVDPESRNLQVYPISRRYNVGTRISF